MSNSVDNNIIICLVRHIFCYCVRNILSSGIFGWMVYFELWFKCVLSFSYLQCRPILNYSSYEWCLLWFSVGIGSMFGACWDQGIWIGPYRDSLLGYILVLKSTPGKPCRLISWMWFGRSLHQYDCARHENTSRLRWLRCSFRHTGIIKNTCSHGHIMDIIISNSKTRSTTTQQTRDVDPMLV